MFNRYLVILAFIFTTITLVAMPKIEQSGITEDARKTCVVQAIRLNQMLDNKESSSDEIYDKYHKLIEQVCEFSNVNSAFPYTFAELMGFVRLRISSDNAERLIRILEDRK